MDSRSRAVRRSQARAAAREARKYKRRLGAGLALLGAFLIPAAVAGTGTFAIQPTAAGGPMGLQVPGAGDVLSVLRANTERDPWGVTGRLPENTSVSPDAASTAPDPGTGAGPLANVPAGPLGIPGIVLQAYQRADQTLARTRPGCGLHWSVLAGIGKIESGHAQGGRVDAHGTTLGRILGPVLAGGPGVAAIRDTDGGGLDGDTTWDRAVGPMQFIPSTWAIYGADGNGDGRADPNNVFDAALAAGNYLCAGGGDLRQSDQLAAAIFRYNHSDSYVRSVLAWARAYSAGVTPLPEQALPIETGPIPPPRHPATHEPEPGNPGDKPEEPGTTPSDDPSAKPTPTTDPPGTTTPPPSGTTTPPPSGTTTPPPSGTTTPPPSTTTPKPSTTTPTPCPTPTTSTTTTTTTTTSPTPDPCEPSTTPNAPNATTTGPSVTPTPTAIPGSGAPSSSRHVAN
ncbi:lytic transglycosylase domain-containing protein [Longimycelium tulufanense]|uniref:lytic transglycosylase domain-containing protein n=1 Tax=Longimycelium tulufanense TaxID=907463 RepID=UPI001E3DFD40|nr:lytic transglycosylase domain-containing protein [Longimycelium tulufanense]